ncbi:MAG: hypothetical protein M3173_02520, partial [Chloroflexota bacterium]|nr:hypothetical protein [Chloroflexota bacterium]
MHVGEARSIARRWLSEHVAPLPRFRGALWHGSMLTLPDDAPLDPLSDVDLIAVFDAPPADLRPGKQPIEGVMLDVTVLPWRDVRDPESVLANHQLAPSFRSPELLADPSGDLAALRDVVAHNFSRREWVERRVERAVNKAHAFLSGIDPGAPFAGNVMSWLFGTGVTTHVLLVAGMRNPTVRKRYVAVRELLRDNGIPQVHDDLLRLLGSARLSRGQASRHLDALEPTFDPAAAAIRTPVPFPASDLSPAARPISIDGSRTMIAAGDHQEAMFWIAVT